MDEDLLQRWISLLVIVGSLEMISSQYTETCEVIIDYLEIGGGNIEYYSKKAIKNIFHTNIDVHSRRLISEFPMDVIQCIENF